MCFFSYRGFADYENWRNAWNEAKANYCCEKAGRGCPQLPGETEWNWCKPDANLMQTWCDSRCDALCHDTMDIDGPHSDSPWQSCPEARVSRISQIWVPWLVLDMEEWFLEDRTKKCIETSDVLEYHLSLFIIEYLECIQNWRSMQQRNNRLIRLLKVQLPFRLLQLVLRMVNSQEVLVLRP